MADAADADYQVGELDAKCAVDEPAAEVPPSPRPKHQEGPL